MSVLRYTVESGSWYTSSHSAQALSTTHESLYRVISVPSFIEKKSRRVSVHNLLKRRVFVLQCGKVALRGYS